MSTFKEQRQPAPIAISGVMPGLAVTAEHIPRTETGIGALMPWADRLWFLTYVSHKAGTGAGTGLFEMDETLTVRKHPESVVGTYANRIIHTGTHQLIIGPHLIDVQGQVRTIPSLVDHRLAATMDHLTDPQNKVYFLTMEGLLFEVDLRTLDTVLLFDLVKELEIPEGYTPHFKAGYTGQGRVVVANNTFDERDFEGKPGGGRLAEWDGNRWTILERTAFNEVTGRRNMGGILLATGQDTASAILKVRTHGAWSTYRLPFASHCWNHAWQTEWPRIREVESERYLMDCSGMFYEISPMAYGGKVWGVRPIATHLRIIPDFCSWRGFLVLAGNQTTPIHDGNPFAGQPQAGLWLGKTDDLWQFGKPKGWGGPWRQQRVQAGVPSDPFLMTGFEHKGLHLLHNANRPVLFTIEVDFLGNGTWVVYQRIPVPGGRYAHYEFPTGFSAHWVRLTADVDCVATAWFVYT